MKKIVIPSILTVALAATIAILVRTLPEARPATSRPAPPIRRHTETAVKATGVIKPMIGAEVRVGSRVSGVVRQLFVHVGNTVREGQLLAELDDRDFVARRDEAKAALQLATANVEYARADLRRKRELNAAAVLSDADEVMSVFRELNREGRTIVIVTHDMAMAEHARRIATHARARGVELLPEGADRDRLAEDVMEMDAMIAELLELERLRNGRGIHPARENLASIVREVADGFGDRPPGMRIIALPREIPVDVEGETMRTVLRNLLENAIKYSLPDSSAVEVSAASDAQHAVLRISRCRVRGDPATPRTRARAEPSGPDLEPERREDSRCAAGSDFTESSGSAM